MKKGIIAFAATVMVGLLFTVNEKVDRLSTETKAAVEPKEVWYIEATPAPTQNVPDGWNTEPMKPDELDCVKELG